MKDKGVFDFVDYAVAADDEDVDGTVDNEDLEDSWREDVDADFVAVVLEIVRNVNKVDHHREIEKEEILGKRVLNEMRKKEE